MKREKNTLLDRSIAAVNSASRLAGALQGNSTRNPVEARLRRELIELAHEIAARELTWGKVGCLSSRLLKNRFLVSGAGAAFELLGNDDLIQTELDAAAPMGNLAPDWFLHRALYEAQPAARAIVQVQPPYSTILIARGLKPDPLQVPEISAYWSQVAWVETEELEARELAAAAVAASQQSKTLLLKRRGVLCWSNSIRELLPSVATLESVARMLWLSDVAHQA